MEKAKKFMVIAGVVLFLISSGKISGITANPKSSVSDQVQTSAKSKSGQTDSKTVQPKKKTSTQSTKSAQTKQKTVKSKAPVKVPKEEPAVDHESVQIGSQRWEIANLNVSTFRNGDSIPQAKSNKDWVTAGDAGKPAWCYYNNNPANGPKYGKLYNWFAVNDPRGLAPAGWVLASDEDWSKLAGASGGQASGENLKNSSGWSEGTNGSNKSGFTGLPGGYRVENGSFLNLGSIGIWWSSTESRSLSAVDHYLSNTASLGRSSSPKQRGESVRCIRAPH